MIWPLARSAPASLLRAAVGAGSLGEDGICVQEARDIVDEK